MAAPEFPSYHRSPVHRDSVTSSTSSSFVVMTPSEHTSTEPESNNSKPANPLNTIRLLTELANWAPLMARLREHQVCKLAKFLNQKLSRLLDDEVTGTEEQQWRILDSLTRLQEGPLGAHTIVGKVVDMRLRSLSGEHSNDEASSDQGSSHANSNGNSTSGGSQSHIYPPPNPRYPVREAERGVRYPGFFALYPRNHYITFHDRECRILNHDGKTELDRIPLARVMHVQILAYAKFVSVKFWDGEQLHYLFEDREVGRTVAKGFVGR